MRRVVAVLILLLGAACSNERRYPIEGQVLAVDRTRQEITLKHGDIKGFMPGMTMSFKVIDPAALTSTKPGDLVRATLVVSESLGRLDNIVTTGNVPLAEDAPAGPGGPMLDVGDMAPDASLVDQDGRTRTFSEWRGKTVAVTFVYTRCPVPDFCPLMDRNFAAVQRAVEADAALAERVHLLSVSFDPDHDTPKVLHQHAQRVGAHPRVWTWLTGPRAEVEKFALAFGVSTMRDDKPSQDIVHNLRTAVIDRAGKIATLLTGNDWTPETLLVKLREADGR
jgi:protein SCO1